MLQQDIKGLFICFCVKFVVSLLFYSIAVLFSAAAGVFFFLPSPRLIYIEFKSFRGVGNTEGS